MNVAKPRKTTSGCSHQLSRREVWPKPPFFNGTSIDDNEAPPQCVHTDFSTALVPRLSVSLTLAGCKGGVGRFGFERRRRALLIFNCQRTFPDCRRWFSKIGFAARLDFVMRLAGWADWRGVRTIPASDFSVTRHRVRRLFWVPWAFCRRS